MKEGNIHHVALFDLPWNCCQKNYSNHTFDQAANISFNSTDGGLLLLVCRVFLKMKSYKSPQIASTVKISANGTCFISFISLCFLWGNLGKSLSTSAYQNQSWHKKKHYQYFLTTNCIYPFFYFFREKTLKKRLSKSWSSFIPTFFTLFIYLFSSFVSCGKIPLSLFLFLSINTESPFFSQAWVSVLHFIFFFVNCIYVVQFNV